jgi:hypothetical protein
MKLSLLLAAWLLATAPAWAGEGHDHGDAAPAAAGPALPRFAAVSETFELVGVLQGPRLQLYLDRAPDNSPVTNATIELEIAGTKLNAAAQPDGSYLVQLAAAPNPGVLPITATVTAGHESDLLAGELDLHEDAHADEAPAPRRAPLLAGAGAAVLLAGIAFHRLRRSRAARQGAAA